MSVRKQRDIGDGTHLVSSSLLFSLPVNADKSREESPRQGLNAMLS